MENVKEKKKKEKCVFIKYIYCANVLKNNYMKQKHQIQI